MGNSVKKAIETINTTRLSRALHAAPSTASEKNFPFWLESKKPSTEKLGRGIMHLSLEAEIILRYFSCFIWSRGSIFAGESAT